AAAVDRYNNYKAALWYWTILGAYVADGTQSDVLCLLKATLWDVKTGARLFEEQTDAKIEKVGPAALVEDKTVLELAKATALEALTRRLDTQLKHLHERTEKKKTALGRIKAPENGEEQQMLGRSQSDGPR